MEFNHLTKEINKQIYQVKIQHLTKILSKQLHGCSIHLNQVQCLRCTSKSCRSWANNCQQFDTIILLSSYYIFVKPNNVTMLVQSSLLIGNWKCLPVRNYETFFPQRDQFSGLQRYSEIDSMCCQAKQNIHKVRQTPQTHFSQWRNNLNWVMFLRELFSQFVLNVQHNREIFSVF